MMKQRSQFGCGYVIPPDGKEVTESLIPNSNHNSTSFAT